MKSKVFIVLISLMLLVLLVGCNKSNNDTSVLDNQVSDTNEPNISDTNNDSDEINQSDNDVNEDNNNNNDTQENGSVQIVINKFIQTENPETFNEENYLKENPGVISAKVDSEGVLSVELTVEKQIELVSSLKGGLDSVLDGLVTNGDMPFIKKVEVSDEYREIKLFVEKGGYESYDYDLLGFLSTCVGSYQSYSGLRYNVEFSVIDEATEEILLIEKYPDKLEAEWERIQKSIELQKQNESDNKDKTTKDKTTKDKESTTDSTNGSTEDTKKDEGSNE